MTMLDQPHQIEFFKLAQVVSRLKIEVETGLTFRQPTLKPAKRYYNLKTSRKDEALKILTEAKNKALDNPTQIWAILAKVRGSKVFITCQCGWQGDQFTATTENESWACPRCGMDESGLEIVRMI